MLKSYKIIPKNAMVIDIYLLYWGLCFVKEGVKPLFIAFRKPHNAVTSATNFRCMRSLMSESGIDVDQFKPHSVRAAATSAASNLGVLIKDILKAANWSRESTFLRFYHKPVLNDNFGKAFGKAILNGR